jgi:hypothetical protein
MVSLCTANGSLSHPIPSVTRNASLGELMALAACPDQTPEYAFK